MARHNISLPDDLSERTKRRAELDGAWHLSWFVQSVLHDELVRWETERSVVFGIEGTGGKREDVGLDDHD